MMNKSPQEEKIVVSCNLCSQKLRVPRLNKKLYVTCPKCRNTFAYQYGFEFPVIKPSEMKGLKLSPVAAGIFMVMAIVSHQISSSLSGIFILMVFISIIAFFVFLFLIFVISDDIVRFDQISKIVVNRNSIDLIDKQDRVKESVQWQQVKSVQIRGLKHLFLGVVETKREPVAIVFNLIDDTEFKLPIDTTLKEKDRMEMVALLEKYISPAKFQTWIKK